MTVAELQGGVDAKALGEEMQRFLTPLFPLTRSITGDGVRRTLELIAEVVPLTIHEVATGTPVLDWTVPREWSVAGATIRGPDGRTVVDFADSNLHLVSYSAPFRGTLTKTELAAHVHTLPERPAWVPYRTSYYQENWGFCMSHEAWQALPDGPYEVVVDSAFRAGSLTYGECVVPGTEAGEVLLTCHVCHPSLANDNLSAIAVAAFLARALSGTRPRYTYRFLFAPGTIGAITWLAHNRETAKRVHAGLVLACLGDPGKVHYKRSERGNAAIDRAAIHVLASSGDPFEVLDFEPFGYDERQYNAPGFRLAVGSLTRTPHGRYPEYHTSADNLSFVVPAALADSWLKLVAILDVLEGNRTYRNLSPYGEPELGRRGLYRAIGGGDDGRRARELALLWVLNQSDGTRSLLDVAERARLPFRSVREAADALVAAALLDEVTS